MPEALPPRDTVIGTFVADLFVSSQIDYAHTTCLPFRRHAKVAAPAMPSLAGALQVIEIPTLSASPGLFVGVGRLGQHPVDLDQYPTDQSDEAGEQREHPSEGHEVQKDRHVLSGARAARVSALIAPTSVFLCHFSFLAP